MKSEEFCYWMQSLFEVADMKYCNEEQWATIGRHLALVFLHDIDPKAGDAAHQAALSAAHDLHKVQSPTQLPPPEPKPPFSKQYFTEPESPFGPKMRC